MMNVSVHHAYPYLHLIGPPFVTAKICRILKIHKIASPPQTHLLLNYLDYQSSKVPKLQTP